MGSPKESGTGEKKVKLEFPKIDVDQFHAETKQMINNLLTSFDIKGYLKKKIDEAYKDIEVERAVITDVPVDHAVITTVPVTHVNITTEEVTHYNIVEKPLIVEKPEIKLVPFEVKDVKVKEETIIVEKPKYVERTYEVPKIKTVERIIEKIVLQPQVIKVKKLILQNGQEIE